MNTVYPSRIALIGFMGSGKSTVGRMLARRIGYDFIDLDDMIEKKSGKPIKEIFALQGEKAFRTLEAEVLNSLKNRSRIVIAAGGGAPIQKENQDFFLNSCFTVYLEVSFKEATKRTGKDSGRPLLSMPEKKLRALYKKRLPVYRKMGTLVLTENKSIEEIIDEIIIIKVNSG